MYFLYSAGLLAVLALLSPYWLTLRKYRTGLPERLGRRIARLKQETRGRCIWIHAVSVGEVLAVGGLIAELRSSRPAGRVLISTTTATGQQLAIQRYGHQDVFFAPIDLALAIRPYLRLLQPDWLILAETEFWPNLLRLARRSGAKVAVVNARISDRSLPGYLRWRFLLRYVLRNVDLFLAQSELDRERLLAIGARAERVQVSGNLKFDVIAPGAQAVPFVEELRSCLRHCNAQPTVVCGSTVEGEEPLLLDAFEHLLREQPGAVMVLAPRRPERFEQVWKLMAARRLKSWRRSRFPVKENVAGGVVLLDSIGELAAVYQLAAVAFVGGTLAPQGGHNILEPAQHGVPILAGPHTHNFRDIVSIFQSADAIEITDAGSLSDTLLKLVRDPARRSGLGGRAAQVFRAHQGATIRTVKALAALEPRREASVGTAMPAPLQK